MDTKGIKLRIIAAGMQAVEELIKVAEAPIISNDGRTVTEEGVETLVLDSEELSAEKLKNAAAAKKLAIFDAFEILSRIKSEEDVINEVEPEAKANYKGFAERHKKKK